MASGLKRAIDPLGRIVIPKEMRNTLNIKEGDHVDISIENGKVVLFKDQSCCSICKSEKDLLDITGVFVCKNCAKAIRELLNV